MNDLPPVAPDWLSSMALFYESSSEDAALSIPGSPVESFVHPLSPTGSMVSTSSSCSETGFSRKASSTDSSLSSRKLSSASSNGKKTGAKKRKSDMTPEELREALLDKRRRNKIAAEKCRKKKRANQQSMTEKTDRLAKDNEELRALLAKRDEEIKYLKSLFSMAVKGEDEKKAK